MAAMDPDRARRLRKRLWAGAFFLAMGLLIWETFSGRDAFTSTIVLELGPRADQVSRVEADLFVGDESAGSFFRDRAPGTVMHDPRFTARFSGPDAVAVIRIQIAGRLIETRRTFRAERDATIYLPLGNEIPSPAPAP
jgi:hypothetical protein